MNASDTRPSVDALPVLTRAQAAELSALRHRRARSEQASALVEGGRLVRDAMHAGAPIRLLVLRHDAADRFADVLGDAQRGNIPCCTASERLFAQLTDTVTPAGIAAVVRIARVRAADVLARRFADGAPRLPLAALAGAADPGNAGTMLRTSDWLGETHLLFSDDAVDPWSPKVLRASMGSVFRMTPAGFSSPDELLTLARSHNAHLAVADSNGGRPFHDWHPPDRCILLFGSEAHGLDTSSFDAERITIPRRGAAESLNLAMAHAIILSHLAYR
jgi:RNA methyltransferase, TrmH family